MTAGTTPGNPPSAAPHTTYDGPAERARFVCATCGADFPPAQTWCPVCAGVSNGSCGSRD